MSVRWRWRIGCVFVAAAVGAAHAASPSRFTPAFAAHGMLGLQDGSLLLWHGDGRVQWRDANGALSAVQRLPLLAIRDVKNEGDGFVASGRDKASGEAVVLTLSASGQPLQPSVRVEGPALVCRPSDLSRLHPALGRCERGGPDGWVFDADFLAQPLRCGSVLALVERGRQPALVLRSLASGKPLFRQRHSTAPTLACVDRQRLLVGGQQLTLLDLPSGQKLWTRKISADRVVDVAAAGGHAFWRVRGRADIFLAPLP